jgi:hypothetical protein
MLLLIKPLVASIVVMEPIIMKPHLPLAEIVLKYLPVIVQEDKNIEDISK